MSRLIYILFIINLTNTTIIAEGYHFFDVFYYKDMFKNYLKQKKNKECLIEDGPNCFHIKSGNMHEKENELDKIYPNDNNIIFENSPENIYLKLKNSVKLINENKDGNKNEFDDDIISFDSPFAMSLLLSFESYDEKTRDRDIYAPETIDTPFELGRITLTIFGKLRLTQKDSKIFEQPIITKEDLPKNTYAYAESKKVIIKFNLKSSVTSLYIKKNKFNQNNKTFFLYGYKNDNRYIITKVQNVPSNHWIKINGDGKKYESIGLERGFDFDNIVINSAVDGQVDFNQMTRKYFSSILNDKISTAINQAINNIKDGKSIKGNNIDPVKVIKINIDPGEIVENKNEEEDFDIPEELLNQIDKREKNENDNKEIRKNNINKKLNEDL
jgi:hypothetical protein